MISLYYVDVFCHWFQMKCSGFKYDWWPDNDRNYFIDDGGGNDAVTVAGDGTLASK